MRSVLEQVNRWREEGRRVALARVVEVKGRAPRGPGAAMAVTETVEVAGSVSGGCVEPAVIEAAQEVLQQGRPRLVTFGISDEQAFNVGLSCGGTIRVFLQPLDPLTSPEQASLDPVRQLQEAEAAVLVTRLSDETRQGSNNDVHQGWPDATRQGLHAGAQWLVLADGRVVAHPQQPPLDEALKAAALKRLDAGKSGLEIVPGAQGGTEPVEYFVQVFAPPPMLHIIGAVHPAAALARAGKFLGYTVTVCDPRSPFATPQRLPDADRIVREWPDEYLRGALLTPRDAVCVLTHDLKFDVPAILAALDSPVGYIGVMGSRRTHERRLKALREAGVGDAALKRLHAPIGLAIGAETPEEMAVAIMAEIIATRSGALG